MADEDLEAIRAQRMAELQGQMGVSNKPLQYFLQRLCAAIIIFPIFYRPIQGCTGCHCRKC